MKFDLWMLDCVTSRMTRVESDVREPDAMEWWMEWNHSHRDCVCVLVPIEITLPKKITVKAA